jgi:HlyD family secretion protein
MSSAVSSLGSPIVRMADAPVTVTRLPQAQLDQSTPHTRCGLIVGMTVVVVFVVGFAVWSTLAPLAEAALAPGTIKVEGSRRILQHLEGGIVRDILVRDGVRVQAGDVVMRLDSVQADATLDTQRAQRWSLLAQDARLVAELAGLPQVVFPADLSDSREPRAREAAAGQRELFEARRANLRSQVAVLQAQIVQQQAAVLGNQGRLAATQRQLEIIRQEEKMRRTLVQEGLARLPDLFAVQRAWAGLDGNVADINGQIEQAHAAIAEATNKIRQTKDQRTQEVSTELREVRLRLAETEEQLRAVTDVVARRDIVAPESGTIVNLRVFTLGAVVKAGDPVMDLVPDNDRLVAEVNVQPSDIDVVHAGLAAEVRLPAFRQRLVPYLRGEVTWVAADVTVNEQSRQQYYRAYILIDADELAKLDKVSLTSGMPVEAHVQLGSRTLFRYLTQPMRDSFHRAFLEQ